MRWLHKTRDILKAPIPPPEQTLDTLISAGFNFTPNRQEFFVPNALSCAKASALSYLKEASQIEEQAKRWGFSIRLLQKGHYFGFVLLRQDMILVVYKGTSIKSPADWFTNINLLPAMSPFGLVHRGFSRATSSLFSQLVAVLAQVQDKSTPLWFTGHSLGGAIALLSAIEVLSQSSLRVSGVYTFGQPAIGSLKFRRTFEKRFARPYFRLVNGIDLVPRLFTGLFRGHVGEEFYVAGNGELFSGDVPWKVKAMDSFRLGQSRLFGHRKYRPPIPQVVSHGIYEYLRILTAMKTTSAPQGHGREEGESGTKY